MSAYPTILCLNAGSSSLKYALFRSDLATPTRLRGGIVELSNSDSGRGINDATVSLMNELAPEFGDGGLTAVGHRVVHGGARFAEPVLLDDSVLNYLGELVPLAPAHQPGSLAGIEAIRQINPSLPQVTCFDTAFHQAMPEQAKRFALPEELWHAGVRRYGFHGLSYEHICGVIGPEIPARTIIAHLGNGSSLVALKDGRPVETTMGFTPNSGLVMGSRCGDLESGVVLHLLLEHGYDLEALDALLNKHSGLRGVSGLSSDMRKLLAKAESHEGARRAIDLFCYSARNHIGALIAVLEGLDLLIFTGGIGENTECIRDRIITPLRRYLDFESRVIPTDEEQVVASHTAKLCPPP